MKLAHLILAHTMHNQLARLIKRLHHPDADIYIHVDKKTDIAQFNDLQLTVPVFFITTRVSVDWGNYNMIEATLNSFEEITSKNTSYTHINLLSSQDYPLKNASQIQNFLFDNLGKTFMRSYAIPEEWDEPLGRLTRYNFGDYKFPGKHLLQNLANRILPDRKTPAGLKMYGRSQWFTITPQCALYVINYLKNNPSVRLFFKHTWACDELVFQTILLNSPLKDSIVNDHLRYIKFKRGDSRPKTLTMTDASDLTASGKLYARKFDSTIDYEILDYLDSLAI
ncbi:MAG: beta-1,6-N-acetylglucosaminyltransferase [Mucilaginibacter sp.]|uniref:beta-1,6-N-acetylglucosaminyltransferase n=1 Tax=Mucilaginibacter sp. TaxID=1882438 RepID=UPI0032655460